MISVRVRIALPLAAAVFATSALFAQGAAPATLKVTEEAPGLLQRAKVTGQAALASAQAKVPKGKFDSAAIEEEDGKLIYSFIFKVEGKTGVDEVAVDAITGKVLGVEHESPATIEKERKADSVAKAKAAAKARGGRGGATQSW
jgi:hypothetical protein